MKPNLDKHFIYAGIALILVIGVIGIIIALTQNNDRSNANETSTEQSSEIATEVSTEASSEASIENDYFYIKPEGQNRVIALRLLEESEIPVPYDFTQYGLKKYKDSRYYALVIVEFAEIGRASC